MCILDVMVEASIVVCVLIFAFAVGLVSNIYVLAFLLALSLFLKKFPPIKLQLFNVIMILTLTLTWPSFREGFIAGIIIALRVNVIYIAFARFVFPLGVAGMYKALVTLRVPEKLRVLMILTLRGINILRERFDAALVSLKLRSSDKVKLKTFAYVTGGVLLQGSERSERMLKAINLRGGFGGFIQ